LKNLEWGRNHEKVRACIYPYRCRHHGRFSSVQHDLLHHGEDFHAEFCASCHEIKPAVVAWRSSTHVNNPQGFVADCMDCHLPAPHKTFDFFFAKTFHGAQRRDQAFHHRSNTTARKTGRRPTRPSTMPNARNAIATCWPCPQTRRHAGPPHRALPRQGYEKKCVDCHYDLVHNDSDHHVTNSTARCPTRPKG
jgi:nitrate/TMAO reductase-like tetraheme cytochrome c subunit